MSHPAAGSESGPHRRILAIVVALIVYGSLYPWRFYERHYFHNPLWILLHTWPAGIDRYMIWDVAVNITLYLPLGLFAYLAIGRRAPKVIRILAPLLCGLILSASIEMIQLYDASRMCSLSDLLSNVTGTAIGMVAGALYQNALQGFFASTDAESLLRPSGALLLLTCWLGYQVFPLFPVWGRTNLWHRLTALRASTLSPADTLIVLAEWLAVALLLESLRKGRIRLLLALLLLLVPGRLIIQSRTLTWSDLAGTLLACAAWLVLPRIWLRRFAPLLLSAALVLGELSPFHFGTAHAFSWTPFRGLFQSDWQDGFVVLFRKSFWYGSVLWLWRASGVSLLWTTSAAAVSLFLLERLQMHLPGRTPETTDAVLALLMGTLLWLLRDS